MTVIRHIWDGITLLLFAAVLAAAGWGLVEYGRLALWIARHDNDGFKLTFDADQN